MILKLLFHTLKYIQIFYEVTLRNFFHLPLTIIICYLLHFNTITIFL